MSEWHRRMDGRAVVRYLTKSCVRPDRQIFFPTTCLPSTRPAGTQESAKLNCLETVIDSFTEKDSMPLADMLNGPQQII